MNSTSEKEITPLSKHLFIAGSVLCGLQLGFALIFRMASIGLLAVVLWIVIFWMWLEFSAAWKNL